MMSRRIKIFHNRSFLSGGSPACLPSKSRVVEAICILLCNKFTSARKASRMSIHVYSVALNAVIFSGSQQIQYASRWKLVVSEYNSIRARLYNSQALLEGTNLMLYNINEGILVIMTRV